LQPVLRLKRQGSGKEPSMSEEHTPREGSNIDEQLHGIVLRIERLNEEKSGISDDIKDEYLGAKSQGYNPKTLRKIIALRKIPAADRKESDAELQIYKDALGMD
jgi:uncharacterized protein (UPF0335 family)